ncbi:hypothetical protein BASA50_003727 [Batrachochytrium salamandrivorans]|uniref:Thioesterase domain-containing protein n=1 Tax=Batrachochytrium salamandrivorans TaxID=1357716 RepID=A0ABQ8FL72_9FUNG|nr:hypothetical protein BASA62_009646 [Batrachochytrium salamandrivorans]KAH6572922.1 hypothetical protein BASA60_006334 [Batrachochytrium salamandrivorans]KAH6598692.1 hypothetical protein BASA50_003727 [Batrachochytrium salamandrivorans]KAH9246721.1 hypothetical protein BASA81_015725 [Batrachochytrium salamandrivorans]KAH9267857.1 hypothetical protein BASA83_009681 [Batrachochytrium salamandrivorans]
MKSIKAAEAVSSLMKLLRADGFSSTTLRQMNVVKVCTEKVVCEMPVDQAHLNVMNGLHGGVTATIVDVIGSLAIAAKTGSSYTGVSTDISVQYLSGGKLGEMLRIEAECPKAGRTLAFSHVRIFTGDKILATGSHTKFVANPPNPSK